MPIIVILACMKTSRQSQSKITGLDGARERLNFHGIRDPQGTCLI